MTEKIEKKDIKPKKKNLQYERDKDREMVRGIFRFHEVPGGQMEFCFKAYKNDPVETFQLIDGQIYTIPLGVAKHLNRNLWYPKYSYVNDEAGRPKVCITEKVRRASFQSLEFIDIEDMTPVGRPEEDIVRVEFVKGV